jgi:hypothetical protein
MATVALWPMGAVRVPGVKMAGVLLRRAVPVLLGRAVPVLLGAAQVRGATMVALVPGAMVMEAALVPGATVMVLAHPEEACPPEVWNHCPVPACYILV